MLLAIFCGCTAWFLSDLVGNPKDRSQRNLSLRITTRSDINHAVQLQKLAKVLKFWFQKLCFPERNFGHCDLFHGSVTKWFYYL